MFRHKCFIAVIFLLVWVAFSNGQESGIPYVHKYYPKEYHFENQTYSIAQDTNGVLYFGSFNGILVYNGGFSDLIQVNGVPQLSSSEDGRLYIGLFNDFGYVDVDESNNYIIKSLISDLPAYKDIGVIQQVECIEDEVLFHNGKYLYRYANNEVELIDTALHKVTLFKVEDKIYIHKYKQSFFTYYNTKPHHLTHSKFKYLEVADIAPYKEGILVASKNKGIFIYGNKSVKPFNENLNVIMAQVEPSTIKRMSNNTYVIGTKKNGVYIVDLEGEIVSHLNKQCGLSDNAINDMFIDDQGFLWVTSNNGINYIEYPSPYSFFYNELGVHGMVNAITRYKENLVVATNHGVYYYNDVDTFNQIKFKPIEGIDGSVNSIQEVNSHFFVCSSKGLFVLDNLKANRISGLDVENIELVDKSSNMYLIGKAEGLCLVEYVDQTVSVIHEFSNFKQNIVTIIKESANSYWLATKYNGVFKMELNSEDYNKSRFVQYKSGFGFPKHNWLRLYRTSIGTVFATSNGVYRYDSEYNKFFVDTLTGLNFFNEDNWVYPIVEDNDMNLWFNAGSNKNFGKKIYWGIYGGENQKYTLITSPFYRLIDHDIQSIYADNDNVTWFGTYDGLIRYDGSSLNRDAMGSKLMLSKFVAGDSILYRSLDINVIEKLKDERAIILPYEKNDICFEVANLNYLSPQNSEYQYYLEGYDLDWSDWTQTPMHIYNNLSEGKYIFHFRTKNINKHISDTAIITFKIRPPIYRKFWAYFMYAIILLSFGFMMYRWRSYLFALEKNKLEKIINDRTEDLVMQKERAEEVVSNIIPKESPVNLGSNEKVSRKTYKMVTVLFSDVKGMSNILQQNNSADFIADLDSYFGYFDQVVKNFNIEKIKTVGDAYMCAGGIPEKNKTNPIEMIMAALEMKSRISEMKKDSGFDWDIRIGIHTGSVTAGFTTQKDMSFDIWGDTVDVASRLESVGEMGEINISNSTYELVGQYFDCEFTGEMPVKDNKEMSFYIVKGYKSQFVNDENPGKPNDDFLLKLQLVRFDDLEEDIMTKLHKGLPKNLYYHNLKHTIDVLTQVEIIGRKEKVKEKELILLKTAALFHDSGFLVGYDDHEELGIKIAKEMLPKYNYSEEQIQQISELIYITKMPPKPKNHLEEIMCDADLDYLGRTDFISGSKSLFQELYEKRKIGSLYEWNKLQIAFIENHQYFTKTARKQRDVNKTKQLDKLRNMVDE